MQPLTSQPSLETDRLVLRAFRETDAGDIQRLAGAREVAEMTLNIPHPYEDGMAQSWISTHDAKLKSGEGVVFAITLKPSGELIGAIGLVIDPVYDRAELGYWIGKAFWGQGFATEAARDVLRFGFHDLGLHRIYATHMTHNPASGRVMQKIGMVSEGLLREHAFKWDRYVDLAVYGILALEWREQQKR